jgi:hypothetical protein
VPLTARKNMIWATARQDATPWHVILFGGLLNELLSRISSGKFNDAIVDTNM